MARVYNRTSEKPRRQLLRRETPKVEEVLWSKLRRRQMLGYKFRRQWQTAIESFGIHFLRFRNVEVFENLDGVLAAIERHLLELRAKP